MNDKSISDSSNKVFVATLTKLTQRYLSLRLRQEDLFGKHREFILFTITSHKFGGKTPTMQLATYLFDRVLLGEEPAVLRFANRWNKKSWVSDPTDTGAFALVGTTVEPGEIQCLTIEGWVPLDVMADVIQEAYGRHNKEKPFRTGLLNFFRKYNDDLGTWSQSQVYTLDEKLVEELTNAGFGN